jgi:hypothetical protein
LTVTLIVFDVAHCGAFGVKTYAPLVVLFIVDGTQVPVIPFGEVVARIGAGVPEQIDKSSKSGVMSGFTTTFKVWDVAHSVAFGVKI